jgi:hypothetical protein
MEEFKLPLTFKAKEDEPAVPVVVEPVVPLTEPAVPGSEHVIEPVIPVVPSTDEPPELFKNLFETHEPDESVVIEDPVIKLVTTFGLELPEGVEEWDAPTLTTKMQEKIDTGRQQLNLDQYDPEVKVLFDYVQLHGGSLMGLPMDPQIQQLNQIALYDPEDFFRLDLGLMFEKQEFTEDEINELIERRINNIPEETRTAYFEKYKTDKVRTEINPLIARRVEELNKEKQLYRDRIEKSLAGNNEKVVESMIKTAEQLNDFVGLPLLQKHKEAIVANIKSGAVSKEIAKDPGGYQMLGYLVKTMGAEATKAWVDLVKNQSASQHYQGVRSTLDQLYGAPPKVPGLKTESSADGNETPLLKWSELRNM